MSQRSEFVMLAYKEDSNISELCRRFGVSRPTAYKWLNRYGEKGADGLYDRSRKPNRSPERTDSAIEEEVLRIRGNHTSWGARKIRSYMKQSGYRSLPAASTVHAVLKRHGKIDPDESVKHTPWQRFEHEEPNDLWQMDFKGHFPLARGRCHPLTILDDHSRFSLDIQACTDEQGATVKKHLETVFTQWGLPKRLLMDNGGPWSRRAEHPYSQLTVWLLRLNIRVCHGRPYHPQTQGKIERFHRTLNAEAIRGHTFGDLAHTQRYFDDFRHVYNHERPHEALGMEVPASRYRMSPRSYPQILPPIEYSPDDHTRKVQGKGEIHFKGRTYLVGKAFHGQPVALRPTQQDGLFDVIYVQTRVAQIDLAKPKDA